MKLVITKVSGLKALYSHYLKMILQTIEVFLYQVSK